LIDILNSPSSNALAVYHAYQDLGIDCRIISDASEISKSTKIIIPGVGSFGSLSTYLAVSGFTIPIKNAVENNVKILGICLGMQILANTSEEAPSHKGFGFINLDCVEIDNTNVRVPHTGWDEISISSQHPITEGLSSIFSAYFSHSYYLPVNPVYSKAEIQYGKPISVIVAYENIVGVQFHPERSQKNGRKTLVNFANW
jgi:glutamine amidotransferase